MPAGRDVGDADRLAVGLLPPGQLGNFGRPRPGFSQIVGSQEAEPRVMVARRQMLLNRHDHRRPAVFPISGERRHPRMKPAEPAVQLAMDDLGLYLEFERLGRRQQAENAHRSRQPGDPPTQGPQTLAIA